MKEGVTGATAKTPENIMFGAGTIHKGLKYTTGTGWNFAESAVGATSGGSKLSIVQEITKVEVDGVFVDVKGLDKKTGGTATMDINMIELTKEIIQAALFAKLGESEDEGYELLEDKPDIEEGDYWDNIAFVGKTLKGKPIIAILDNALCTTGFEPETKNKEGVIGKFTFKCTGELDKHTDTLPWHIYYPKVAA